MVQAERRFTAIAMFGWVGTALSADWMRPSRFSGYSTGHACNRRRFAV